ncbi:hypothetical protein JL721_237 [Aureococcus anophagefferens]|nr:hypothetical protein JL721_237 [Aureococcus anophagefferens]
MASCPKMQTLMALAVELSHKLERRPKEIYARGVPGVHVDVFSSGAAVEALQTCAGLAKETREEARRVWEQLVAASFVKHVSSSRRKRNSLDQGMGRERKDKVGAHTLYRFDDRAFAPYTLHVAVLAVRGLPPGHTASSMVAVGGQNSDFTALHDDARRGAARESDMPNFKGSDLGHAHRGSAAIHATDWYQSVNTEFEAYGYDPEWPDAPTAARVGFEWSLVGGRLCGRAGANRATAAVDLRLPSTMHLQSKAAADQPTKTPHAHDADGNLICDLLSDKAAYRFEHDSYEHCVAKHARWARATADDDSEEVLTGAPIEVLVAAYVTRRRNDGSKENARDSEKQNSVQNWRVYARVHKCEGSKSGVPILVKSQVVLEFGSKIAATERLTVARQKDFSSDGCDFGGQRLRNVGLVARRNAQVKFTLYERLKTDLTKTRTLGNVSVPLSDVPVLEPHKGRGVLAKHREPSPQRYDLTYRRIIDGSEIKNGTVYLSVWMSPLLSVSDFARYFAKALRWGFWAAFVGLTAGLAYAFRGGLFEACLFVSPLPILLLLMEAPQFLTWVLGLAVPGLNLGFGALRLTCWFSDTKPSAASSPQDAAALAAGASRRLCLRVEVDDFSIGNPGRPGTHAHEHFVFAAKVVLAISLDARLFHGAVDLAKNALQSAWDYKRDLAEAKRKKTAPLPKPPRVVMWSPFPAVHAEQRNDEDFEPTRIGSLRFDEIRVDDVNVAFNQSTANEFNINHFVRGLAAGKVGQALPPGAKAPNALTVTVVGARGVHEKIAPQIEVHCRDFRWETSARPAARSGAHVWNESCTLPAGDPSAVLHVGLKTTGLAASSHILGQWIVTLKMLVVAPTNVFGENLSHAYEGGSAFVLEGDMHLRNAEWLVMDRSQAVRLRLRYFHDPALPSYEDQINAKPRPALEQLQANSLETTWKMGSLTYLRYMLQDFPLLFDVRSFEVTRINFYLKDLFSSVGRAAASTSMIEKAKMERSSSGQIKNHVWTFVFCAVRPVLREVNVGAALGHIASGFFAGSNPAGAGTSAAAAARGLVDAARGAGGTMVHTSTLAKDAVLRAVHHNADKYVDERDNALMLETALAEGYLDKAVERLSGCRLGRRPWVLEWCVLKQHDGHLTLFYTKKNDSGFHGATKKARLSEVRYDASEGQFCVLVTKLGKRKKILHFRASKFRGAATDKVLAVGEW